MILDIFDIVTEFTAIANLKSKESARYYSVNHPHVSNGLQLIKASDFVIDYPRPCSEALKAYLKALPEDEFHLFESICMAGRTGTWEPIEEHEPNRDIAVNYLCCKINIAEWATNGYLLYKKTIDKTTEKIINKTM